MPTPDYQRIGQLERELGIGQASPSPERPMRTGRTHCLVKDCDGTDTDFRTWQGFLIRRIHEH